jgi:hypothetical protein
MTTLSPGFQGCEDSALNQLGWSQFAVGRRGLKDRQATPPIPPYGVDKAQSETPQKAAAPDKSSPKTIPFVMQMPAGCIKQAWSDEAKFCRYEGRELMAGKRRSYPQHPAVAHVSHIQHVTNALPEAAAKSAPSAEEIPYARGGRVVPASHRYFKENPARCTLHQVQPTWWG